MADTTPHTSTPSSDDLVPLEEAGWRALRSGGAAARAFYDDVLDEQVTMLLPGGLVLADRDAALDSMAGPPWDEVELSDWAVHALTDDVALLTYAAQARRGEMRYAALVSSLYARRPGGWRLAAHQQTPR